MDMSSLYSSFRMLRTVSLPAPKRCGFVAAVCSAWVCSEDAWTGFVDSSEDDGYAEGSYTCVLRVHLLDVADAFGYDFYVDWFIVVSLLL
jgi:hypothetical protein